jgi:hypothetical protein
VTPAALPPSPTNVVATAGTGSTPSATVTWTPPSSDGGDVITSYTVTGSSGAGTCTYVVQTPSANACTFTTLPLGGPYTFTVAATSSAGTGADSAPSNALDFPKTATTTSLTASPTSAGRHQSVLLTATVSTASGTPTGKVTFTVGSKVLGTVNLASGIAALSTTKLPKGIDTVTATYSGSPTLGTSIGTVMVTIHK